MNKPIEKPGTVIWEISSGGTTINLKDGSRWKIAPYFKQEVFDLWRHHDTVTVREASDDPQYPFTIYNTEAASEVAAQKIS
jgi:hypothetical protein